MASLVHGFFSIYVTYNCPTDSVIALQLSLQLPMNSDLFTSLYTFRLAEDLLTAEYCTGRAMAVFRDLLKEWWYSIPRDLSNKVSALRIL